MFLLEKSGSTRPRGRICSLPDWSPQKQVNAKFLLLAELCGQSRVILGTSHGYSWVSLTLLFPSLCCGTLPVIPAQLPGGDCSSHGSCAGRAGALGFLLGGSLLSSGLEGNPRNSRGASQSGSSPSPLPQSKAGSDPQGQQGLSAGTLHFWKLEAKGGARKECRENCSSAGKRCSAGKKKIKIMAVPSP